MQLFGSLDECEQIGEVTGRRVADCTEELIEGGHDPVNEFLTGLDFGGIDGLDRRGDRCADRFDAVG